uniref:Peptidase S1 domain-containing protein n=1 Tax=Steinernema glaseri TaxID=37863 RepID=A0A1I8A075_9BILA
MPSMLLLILATIAVTSSLTKPLDSNLVFGGQEVDSPAYPFNLVILIPGVGKEKIVVCGAALISPRYALTAAHCPGFIDSITVYGGVYDTENLEVDGAQSSAIKDFFPHPKFYGTGPMVYNDIAVIELSLSSPFHSKRT